jgi:hypothetical protein
MKWLITYTNLGRLQHPKSGLSPTLRASLQTSSYPTRKPQVSPDIQSLNFRVSPEFVRIYVAHADEYGVR